MLEVTNTIYIDDAQDLRDMVWSGARDTLDDLTDEQIETVMECLAELTAEDEKPLDKTAVNDFLWFERDTVAEWLGFEDYEQLMQRRDDMEV